MARGRGSCHVFFSFEKLGFLSCQSHFVQMKFKILYYS
jgi:hypothetical protein